ncbi:MAG TPA: hypothetical protein VN181_08810 [Thermoanaerobaculia bacterium]|nr:hypothetical protein [Thermoanaerobaculia bacterium]
MKHALLSFAVIALAFSGACRNDTSSNTVAAREQHVALKNPTPDQLGVIGAQLQANPNEAARILAQQGLTEARFEQAVRKVAESPDASREYAAAFHKAGGR